MSLKTLYHPCWFAGRGKVPEPHPGCIKHFYGQMCALSIRYSWKNSNKIWQLWWRTG